MDKLLKYSKLSNYQIRKVIEYFALELTAVQTSKHLKLNRKTVDRIYQTIREKIPFSFCSAGQKFCHEAILSIAFC